jgi:hypothetical protein
MFFSSCSLILLIFKTSEQQLDLLLEAIIGNNTCKATTRTTKNNTPIKKRLKRRKEFGSRIANAANAKNGTIVEKAHLSRDLNYNTQDYMLDIF